MTREAIEACRAKLIHDIGTIEDEKTLSALQRIINKAYPKQVVNTPKKSKRMDFASLPCCYTFEEVRSRIIDGLKSYEQGEFITYNEQKKHSTRWK